MGERNRLRRERLTGEMARVAGDWVIGGLGGVLQEAEADFGLQAAGPSTCSLLEGGGCRCPWEIRGHSSHRREER